MEMPRKRLLARNLMFTGSIGILSGIAVMVHGEINFGDAVLITGILVFVIGVIILAATPSEDHDAL